MLNAIKHGMVIQKIQETPNSTYNISNVLLSWEKG